MHVYREITAGSPSVHFRKSLMRATCIGCPERPVLAEMTKKEIKFTNELSGISRRIAYVANK
jgi:hypothetical protein